MFNEIMVSGRKLEIEAVNYMEDNAFVSLVLDTSGQLIHASPFFYQLTGFSRDEVLGKVLFQSTDETVAISLAMAISIAKKTGDNWQGEISQQKKNGEMLWLDTRLMPRRDETGEIFAFILLGFDITRHMAIREKLHFRAHNDALTKTLNRQGYYIRSRKKSVPLTRAAHRLWWRYWISITLKILTTIWGMRQAMKCCAALSAG